MRRPTAGASSREAALPSFPIKPRGDEDFYVLWSTVVDAAVGYGTRAEVAEMMLEDSIEWAKQQIEWSLERADTWQRKESLIVMEGPGGQGTLPFDCLYDYAQYLKAGEEGAAASLVKPEDW